MSNIDKLTLVSGVDILIEELGIVIRQPKIREIALLGEKKFYSMCSFLLLDKKFVIDKLKERMDVEEVEKAYETLTEYEVVVSLLESNNSMLMDTIQILTLLFPDYNIRLSLLESNNSMLMDTIQILTLLFPDYNIRLDEIGIIFVDKNDKVSIVHQEKYTLLRDIIKEILCLNGSSTGDDYNPADSAAEAIAEKLRKRKERLNEIGSSTGDDYNPADSAAEAIAEKLRKRKERLNEIKPKEDKYILANYFSALGAGSNSYNLVNGLDLTLYQLFDWVKRYGAWDKYKIDIQSILAGAKDVEIKEWYGTLE